MKKYTKETTHNKLEITYDMFPDNPREWDNLGYFVTNSKKYASPDGEDNDAYDAMMEACENGAHDAKEHAKKIASIMEAKGHDVIDVYQVSKYEHGLVSYSLGVRHGWDSGVTGFYVVTEETRNVLGTPDDLIEEVIKQELETYTKYANGQVYSFILYSDDGEVGDSCGGFYSLEDIRDHLPEDWADEDLSEYFKR